MSDGGKGDKRRPAVISQEELKARWEAVFPPKGKKEKDIEDIGATGRTSKAGNFDCPSCKCGEVCSREET